MSRSREVSSPLHPLSPRLIVRNATITRNCVPIATNKRNKLRESNLVTRRVSVCGPGAARANGAAARRGSRGCLKRPEATTDRQRPDRRRPRRGTGFPVIVIRRKPSLAHEKRRRYLARLAAFLWSRFSKFRGAEPIASARSSDTLHTRPSPMAGNRKRREREKGAEYECAKCRPIRL